VTATVKCMPNQIAEHSHVTTVKANCLMHAVCNWVLL